MNRIDNSIYLPDVFSGEMISFDAYAEILERLSNPLVIVTLIPGRCGITFFSGIVGSTRLCGTGKEVFNPRPAERWRRNGSSLVSVFETCLKTVRRGGVCWFQITPSRFENLASIIDRRVLTSWKYSIILRRDILSQAISYLYAKRSGIWHSTHSNDEIQIELDSDEAVKSTIREILAIERQEEEIRKIIRRNAKSNHFVRFYEDIVISPREEALRFFRLHGIRYEISDLSFDGKDIVERLKKTGDLELYDACCGRIPWIERLVLERKRMLATW